MTLQKTPKEITTLLKGTNVLHKEHKDFPFNLVLAGNCKVLDGWLDQLMEVSESGDVNLLIMKFNRKGRFIAVQSSLTWITDQFLYYTSANQKDWLIMDFEHFFNFNKDLLKSYSYTGTTPIQSPIDTTSPSIITPKNLSNIPVN